MTKAQVKVPLDIPDVRVLKTEMNKEGELIITIESTKAGTTCRVCGRWISKSTAMRIGSRCDICLYLGEPRTCAIVPDAINVRNVRITQPPSRNWIA